jgi:outer membrane protein
MEEDMKTTHAIGGAALLAFASLGHAQTAGSIVLGTGWFHLAPQESSDALRETNVGGSPVSLTSPNARSNVTDSDTFGASLSYYFTDNVSTEFVFGVPPKFDLRGSGTLAQFGKLGETRQWSPALILRYHFLGAQSKVRPYIGIGISRVWFTGAKLTNNTFEQSVAHGPTSVSVDSSWTPVFNAGLTYQFAEHWSVGLSVSYLPLTTAAKLDTTATTPVGPLHVKSEAKIRLNPIITFVNVAYRF